MAEKKKPRNRVGETIAARHEDGEDEPEPIVITYRPRELVLHADPNVTGPDMTARRAPAARQH